MCSVGSPQQHPHLCCSGGVHDQDRPHQQGSCHQLAEEQTDHRQRPQVYRSHVHPQVSVPPAFQSHQPGDHDRPWDRNRSLYGLHPREGLAQRARYFTGPVGFVVVCLTFSTLCPEKDKWGGRPPDMFAISVLVHPTHSVPLLTTQN